MDGTKGSDYLDCLNPKAADTDPHHQQDPGISQVFMRACALWSR